MGFQRTSVLALFVATASVASCVARPSSAPVASATVRVGACDTVSTMRAGARPVLPSLPDTPPSTAAVVGTIRDRETGVALRQVVVRLHGPSDHTVATDSVGAFVISGLPPGIYSIETARIGYDVFVQSRVLRAGAVDTLQIAAQFRSCP